MLQITTTIKWIVDLFPRSMRGILAILLIVCVTLGTTVVHLYREQDRMQLKLDDCNQDKYAQMTWMRDSLARRQETENERLAQQNELLRQEMEQIRNIKIKLHE